MHYGIGEMGQLICGARTLSISCLQMFREGSDNVRSSAGTVLTIKLEKPFKRVALIINDVFVIQMTPFKMVADVTR